MNEQKKIIYRKRFIEIFHNPITAWIILFLSLSLTVAAYFISESFVYQRAKDRFQYRTEEIQQAIEDRLHIYEQILWGGVGFIYSSEKLSREGWKKYVDVLDINKHWPGIQGLGYSIVVSPQDKEKHIEQIRREGFPDYTIKPKGERDFYTAIIYLEPFDWRNKRAFGYDMWSNPVRKEAMMCTRDTGEATTSGIITLVQETNEDVQKGFLTYVPVFKSKTIPSSADERREQFVGWVYAAFRAKNLMNGILGTEDASIEFEIYDSEKMSQQNLLFDSNNTIHLNQKNHDPLFQKTVNINLQGRIWTIYFNTPKDFSLGPEENQPVLIVIAGTIIDLLLFYVIFSLYFINKRAQRMADQMTQTIQKSNENLEKIVEDRTAELIKARQDLENQVEERTKELSEKVKELEMYHEVTMGRENRIIELKTEINQLAKALGKTEPYDLSGIIKEK